ERVDRLLARAAIHFESEMRELDRHLARQPALPHRGEDAEVVVPHGDGLGPVADLLAELGEHAPQAGAGELGGGVERGTQVFTRQETPHRPPEERAATQLLRERGGSPHPAALQPPVPCQPACPAYSARRSGPPPARRSEPARRSAPFHGPSGSTAAACRRSASPRRSAGTAPSTVACASTAPATTSGGSGRNDDHSSLNQSRCRLIAASAPSCVWNSPMEVSTSFPASTR